MKIAITGDIHGDLSLSRIKYVKELGYDCLIITGDFGYFWDNSPEELKARNEINNLGLKCIFIDGNHENFKLLNQLEATNWCGGKVKKYGKNIIYLCRGEYYTINDKTFFVLGGASSIDKIYRTPNIDWFEEELPSPAEIEHAFDMLKLHNYKVDYILTHTCPSNDIKEIVTYGIMNDSLTDTLMFIDNRTKYKHWYFGHFHTDLKFKNKTCLYKQILPLE